MYNLKVGLIVSIGQYENMQPEISCECENEEAVQKALDYFIDLQRKLYIKLNPRFKNWQEEMKQEIKQKYELEYQKNVKKLQENDKQNFPKDRFPIAKEIYQK